ncbi:MAG: exosortase system-associated protein, TIGR04073 family [Verrucomicrobiales bacterium]|nr:exosortase system-associated protein, TIGR04073 family [Verrucomicrobiae bacterium]
MKKLSLVLVTLGIVGYSVIGSVTADIQDPPAGRYGKVRKLSRAVSNVIYGITEVPNQWTRVNNAEGGTAAASYGTVNGAVRTVRRLGYGIYELFTFPFPTYKSGYRVPYTSNYINPETGINEFPPELGFMSDAEYGRNAPTF